MIHQFNSDQRFSVSPNHLGRCLLFVVHNPVDVLLLAVGAILTLKVGLAVRVFWTA